MNNLHLSKEAQNDLIEIKTYITKELENPDAALATVSRITTKIHILKNQAYVGTPLSSVTETYSDYRFLVCGNYLVFYRVYEKEVYIDRVLYGRRDYMRILFNDVQTDETGE